MPAHESKIFHPLHSMGARGYAGNLSDMALSFSKWQFGIQVNITALPAAANALYNEKVSSVIESATISLKA